MITKISKRRSRCKINVVIHTGDLITRKEGSGGTRVRRGGGWTGKGSRLWRCGQGKNYFSRYRLAARRTVTRSCALLCGHRSVGGFVARLAGHLLRAQRQSQYNGYRECSMPLAHLPP